LICRDRVARIIFGADPRDAGEIRVGGYAVDIRTPHAAVQAGIGYLSKIATLVWPKKGALKTTDDHRELSQMAQP
jgi:hypothetical protein